MIACDCEHCNMFVNFKIANHVKPRLWLFVWSDMFYQFQYRYWVPEIFNSTLKYEFQSHSKSSDVKPNISDISNIGFDNIHIIMFIFALSNHIGPTATYF